MYGLARSYPDYLQCDKEWANDIMGSDNDTICQVGCLMSSVSMAIAGYSIPIQGQLSTVKKCKLNITGNVKLIPTTKFVSSIFDWI